MYWVLRVEERSREGVETPACWDGGFVLQRHHDEAGPHMDLRLEQDGYLMGWRVDGQELSGTCWAMEKGPHPLEWLEHDGDSVREDKGVYAWVERGSAGGVLALSGERQGLRFVDVRREAGLGLSAVRGIAEALSRCGARVEAAAGLIADGVSARHRAVGRLCGLARELDGSAFEEVVARRMLGSLTLEEIHAQLRAYEVRFDQKYPPQPVSRPERLPESERDERADVALAILRTDA